MWDECNCAIVWAFFGIAFLWDRNENWPFSELATAEFSKFAGILSTTQHHHLGFEIAQLKFCHLHMEITHCLSVSGGTMGDFDFFLLLFSSLVVCPLQWPSITWVIIIVETKGLGSRLLFVAANHSAGGERAPLTVSGLCPCWVWGWSTRRAWTAPVPVSSLEAGRVLLGHGVSRLHVAPLLWSGLRLAEAVEACLFPKNSSGGFN